MPCRVHCPSAAIRHLRSEDELKLALEGLPQQDNSFKYASLHNFCDRLSPIQDVDGQHLQPVTNYFFLTSALNETPNRIETFRMRSGVHFMIRAPPLATLKSWRVR